MDGTRRIDWGSGFGATTAAFVEWSTTDSDLRAFLDLTTRWINERFQQVWDEIGRQPWYDGAPEQDELFYRALGGIEPIDYDWMLQSSVVRDAVSAYEVYLEKAGEEVLHRHGHTWKVSLGRTPRWGDMVAFYHRKLGIEVDSDRVKHIRQLRHSLTHLRGELRTSEQRQAFGRNADGGFLGYRAELSVETATVILDDLASSVRDIDRVAWRFSHGDSHLDFSSPA